MRTVFVFSKLMIYFIVIYRFEKNFIMILELATYFSRKNYIWILATVELFITVSLKRFSSSAVKKHQNNSTETMYKISYIFDNLDPLRIPIFLEKCNRRPGLSLISKT